MMARASMGAGPQRRGASNVGTETQRLKLGRLCQRAMTGLLQQAIHGLHVERPGEEESLSGVYVLGGQLDTLTVVLDAFGDGFEPEGLAQLDHGVDESDRLLRVSDPRHEGAVD